MNHGDVASKGEDRSSMDLLGSRDVGFNDTTPDGTGYHRGGDVRKDGRNEDKCGVDDIFQSFLAAPVDNGFPFGHTERWGKQKNESDSGYTIPRFLHHSFDRPFSSGQSATRSSSNVYLHNCRTSTNCMVFMEMATRGETQNLTTTERKLQLNC